MSGVTIMCTFVFPPLLSHLLHSTHHCWECVSHKGAGVQATNVKPGKKWWAWEGGAACAFAVQFYGSLYAPADATSVPYTACKKFCKSCAGVPHRYEMIGNGCAGLYDRRSKWSAIWSPIIKCDREFDREEISIDRDRRSRSISWLWYFLAIIYALVHPPKKIELVKKASAITYSLITDCTFSWSAIAITQFFFFGKFFDCDGDRWSRRWTLDDHDRDRDRRYEKKRWSWSRSPITMYVIAAQPCGCVWGGIRGCWWKLMCKPSAPKAVHRFVFWTNVFNELDWIVWWIKFILQNVTHNKYTLTWFYLQSSE